MTEPATDDAEPGAVGSAAWWHLWQRRQARRRPRADGLTVERIVAAALTIVDTEGLDALTVRRIADEFGTGSATLYRHYTSREELLELLVDHVLGDVRLPPPGLGWRVKVELLSGELRRVLMEHANLVPALATSPLLGPNAMRGADNGLALLLEAGYAPELAVLAYRALLDYVLGTVFFDTSRVGRGGPTDRDNLDDEAAPTLRAHKEAITATSSEVVFQFGLQALLDGIEQRFPSPRPKHTRALLAKVGWRRETT
jgi:TetR/AcrR family tetracycline transcriptional repressor